MLFPLPGLDLRNPLAGGSRHRIPGTLAGEPISWEVDTAGGREHLLLLASTERLVEFERELEGLDRPSGNRLPGTPLAVPDEARVVLRGIGGLVVEPPGAGDSGGAGRVFGMAERLASEAEVVEGAWLRRIVLENPGP